MALDKTSLCNVALGHIGQPEIQDIDEDESTPARVCRTHFDLVRDSLFEKHDWDFLTKRLVLAKDATAPVNGYDNAFVLPTNWLRVLALNETDAKLASHLYAVENLGDETTDKIRLFTDHSEATVRYVAKVTDTGKWSAAFRETFCYFLAKAICLTLTQDFQLKDAIEKDAFYTLGEALKNDANQARHQRKPSPESQSRLVRSHQRTGDLRETEPEAPEPGFDSGFG